MVGRFGEKVYKLVRQIPKGKVVTYRQIADKSKINPRMAGHILHLNTDRDVPCHRVVNRAGKIAQNYAFGGWKEQKKKLESENVKFRDKMHVDLKKYQWSKF